MEKIKRILFLLFGSVMVISCTQQAPELTKIKGTLIVVDSTKSTDSKIQETIAPYKTRMIEEISTVISYAPKNIIRTDGNLQSSLGNLLADLCFVKADSIYFAKTGKHADFSLFNYGGIRAGINKGPVINKNAFELMPFDNTLVVVEMTAQKIEELARYFYKNKKAHPLSKQVEMIVGKKGCQIKIKGENPNSNKTYNVITSNYLQSGGDRMYFFRDPVSLYDTNYLMRDAIKSYFKSQDTLRAQLDGRVKVR